MNLKTISIIGTGIVLKASMELKLTKLEVELLKEYVSKVFNKLI